MLGVILLCAWEFIAVLIAKPKLFPSLSYLLKFSLPSIANFSTDGKSGYGVAFLVIFKNAILSIYRCVFGFSIGYIAGILYGLSGREESRSERKMPILLTFSRNIPLLALIPLFLYWFGGTEIGMILYIAFAVFIIVATNTQQAVFNVPQNLIEQAGLLGADQKRIIWDVIYPYIQGELAGAVKYLAGLIWAVSLASEYLASSSGLGFLIYQSYSFSDMGKLIILSLLYCFLSICSYQLVHLYLKKKLAWI